MTLGLFDNIPEIVLCEQCRSPHPDLGDGGSPLEVELSEGDKQGAVLQITIPFE